MATPLTPRSPVVERVNVNFPRPVLDDLRRLVPRSRRSEVIARATARELRRLKLAAMFAEFEREPLWPPEDHPDLLGPAAIDTALSRLRTGMRRVLPSPAPRRKGRRE